MEKKINVKENQEIEIVISCSGEEWKKAQKKEMAKREANLTVKGFRKGHVPSNIAQKYINMAEVINDALLEMVNKGYVEAVTEGKYQVFSEPKLGVNKVTADEFGGVSGRTHSQENINIGYAYLGVSSLFGPLSYIFLFGEY